VEQAALSAQTLEELSERFALVYTGQRRLARNLLREIMGKYILNNPETVDVLNRIQQLAVLMRFDLERGDVDGFARLLDEHWELSRSLDPGSTNTCIDQIIKVCRPLIDGVMISGAGGGGFLQMILKRGVSREQLADCLADVFQDNGIALWESAFVMA
jgi:fucokinase